MTITIKIIRGVLLFAFLSAFSLQLEAAEKPNVLFLFTDDQRADTISALGNPHIHTPHLDTLSKNSFVFRNAYCLGSNAGAVCFPSRNMLLSGRDYFQFRRKRGNRLPRAKRYARNFASAKKPNFPQSMNEAGYFTYHHGKKNNTALEIHKKFDISKYIKPNDNQVRLSGQPGKQIVNEAIEFVSNHKKKDTKQPFFMYLAFSTPHDPRVAVKKFRDQYDPAKIPLPKNYMPVHPFDNGEMTVRDEKLAPWPRTKTEVRKQLHDYYSSITGLDHHIGRLLAHLKKSGQYENTIIIFSSDHGLAIGSHGLMGKQSIYEHSMKAPLFMTGPGIKKGSSDALVYLLDIFPTTCDLVDATIPEGLTGKSLKPIMTGKKKSVRDSLFTSYKEVQRAVRDDRWKLIRFPHINKTVLFDLKNDPDELIDLSKKTDQQQRVKQLFALLKEWQNRLGDKTPLTSDKPQDPAFIPPNN